MTGLERYHNYLNSPPFVRMCAFCARIMWSKEPRTPPSSPLSPPPRGSHKHLHGRLDVRYYNRFSFYQRWFDTVFLLSGCVTAVTLLAFHLANRNSDADHHDHHHHHEDKKRIDHVETFSGTGMVSSIPGDRSMRASSSSDGGGGVFGSGVRPRGRVVASDHDEWFVLSEKGKGVSGAWKAGNRRLSTKQA